MSLDESSENRIWKVPPEGKKQVEEGGSVEVEEGGLVEAGDEIMKAGFGPAMAMASGS